MLYGLAIVSGVVILSWPRHTLFHYIDSGNGPLLFFLSFSASLVILSYINMLCGRGELIKSDFPSYHQKEWVVREKELPFLRYGLPVMTIHTLFILLPFLPVLIIASAVSGISPAAFTQALSMLIIASLLSRFFGFFLILLLGRFSSAGYLLNRGFIAIYLFGTAAFAPVFNPLHILYDLHKTGPLLESYFFHLAASLMLLAVLAFTCMLMINRHIHMEKNN